MISFISSLDIINVVREAKSERRVPDPNIFLWLATSVAVGAAVNPNGIKTILGNCLSAFPIKGNPVSSSNGLKSLPKNPLDCPILCSWVFDDFILADELFAKALWSREICVLVNNKSCEKNYFHH